VAIGLGAIVLSNSGAKAQNWPSPSEIDEAPSVENVDKKSVDDDIILENEKRGGARAFSKPLQTNGDDEDLRMKRPGGRTTSMDGGHRLFKRPGARFMAPSGGGGMFGGLAKRPGGRFYFADTNRAKRPGGRYSFGTNSGMLKRLGGRYSLGNLGGGGANRWKRAGGRHVGGYNSFYGLGQARSYRTNWGRR